MGNARTTTDTTKQGASKREALWSVTFVLVLFIHLFTAFNGNGVHNGVAVLIEQAGGPVTLTGLVSAVFSIVALVMRFFAGYLSDAYGRRKVILGGAVSLLIGCIVGLLSFDIRLFVVARMFSGAGFGIIGTCVAAATADIVPKSRTGEGLGYQGLAFALSIALGPAIAMALAMLGGRFLLFGVFTGLTILAFVFTMICRFPEAPKEAPVTFKGQGMRGVLAMMSRMIEKRSFRPALVAFLQSANTSFNMTFISVYAISTGLYGSQYFFIAAAIVMLVLRFSLASLFDRLHVNALYLPACACGIVAIVILIFVKATIVMPVAGAFFGAYVGLAQPPMTAEAIRRAPDTRRGAASATYYIGCDIGVAAGSLLWGVAISQFGFQTSFCLVIGLIVITMLAALILLRKRPEVEK